MGLDVGGIIPNNHGEWAVSFSHYEFGGDTLLVELCVIQMSPDLCYNKGYNNLIYESDCMEVIDQINVRCDHTLHIYMISLLQII